MGNGNCTLIVSVPGTNEYLNEILDYPAILAIILVCTLITIVLFVSLIESACFLEKNVRPSAVANHRITTWWMIAVLPILSCVVLPGLYSPISASFCNLVASLCFSFTMFKFLVIVMNYYGGYKNMVLRFSVERFLYPLSSAPLTCCCPCLPQKRLTRNSFKWLKIAVLQMAILKPVTSFIGVIVWLDNVYLTDRLEEDKPFVFVNLSTILSSMIAMMALNMMNVASSKYLESYHIAIKFNFIKLGILVCSVQPALLGLLMRFRIFECVFPYTNHARANILQCVLLILEAGIMFPFVRKYYRRSEGNVVGSCISEIPSEIVNLPGINSRWREYGHGRHGFGVDDGPRRQRGWTVIGSGEAVVGQDFVSSPRPSLLPTSDNNCKVEVLDEITPPSAVNPVPKLLSERVATQSFRKERRYTIS